MLVESSDVAEAIQQLRDLIPVIDINRLESLPKDDTSSEAEAVYFDKDHGAVYKRYAVEDGLVTNGLQPGCNPPLKLPNLKVEARLR